MSNKITYTNEQLCFLHECRLKDLDWETITDKYNKKFGEEKTASGLTTAYCRYGDIIDLNGDEVLIKTLRSAALQKKNAGKANKINRLLVDEINDQEAMLNAISDVVKKLNIKKHRKSSYTKSSNANKHAMTIELLISDVHYGKKTDTFNLSVCRERMKTLTELLIREIKDSNKVFEVEKLIVALMGDIIESYTMHGLESAASCEFGNSEQIFAAVLSLWEDVLEPLGKLNIPIVVPAVTGNHDRISEKKTYNLPGRSNVTYYIYNTLRLLCEQAGYSHIEFLIADGPYVFIDIYGNTSLYEHGDILKNINRGTIETHIANRSQQINKVIDFFRFGHWHEPVVFDRGRIVVNGCVPGQDSFADVLGYNTKAMQTINYYIQSDAKRNTSFYKSFPVDLENIPSE